MPRHGLDGKARLKMRVLIQNRMQAALAQQATAVRGQLMGDDMDLVAAAQPVDGIDNADRASDM